MDTNFSIDYDSPDLKIRVSGTLGVVSANHLLDELKDYSTKEIKNIIFYFNDLEYIASSGLRVLIYSKQKIAPDSQLYVIKPNEMVLEVLQMTGLCDHITIQDEY